MKAFSETDGRRLAVEMLDELAEVGADAANIDAGTRMQAGFHGAQRNVVADYLRRIREANSAELEAGIGEVLSDFIASALEGGAPAPGFYEERISQKLARLNRERV